MQNILDIKLKLESQAKIAYSQANAALREEEAKLLKLFERKNAYDNRAKELVEGKIDLLEIKKCRQAIESMKVLIRRQMMQVQVAEKNVEAARQKLEEVMKERKTQEKLREKDFEDFKEHLNLSSPNSASNNNNDINNLPTIISNIFNGISKNFITR